MTATEYQATVVGGGPAGLTAAPYTTRLGHDTAVIDRGGGRAAMMADTHNVIGVTEDVSGVENDDEGWLEAMEFADGTRREYRGGFAMYGSDYNTDLAEQLGCELNDDGTVAVDDHGATSVDGVYAVGDMTPGHNQIPTAMGEGARAGIDIHYGLREFPKSLGELEAEGEIGPEDVPGMADRIRRRARRHEGNGATGVEAEAADD
jgi:thioredoxin reductase (NADPH)